MTARFQGLLGATMVATFFSIVVLIISFATPYWVSGDSGPLDVRAGLWERCECETYDSDDVDDWLRAVQVLLAISIFLLHAMVFLLLLILCSPFFRVFPCIVAFICVAFLTVVILFICMVIAGIEFTDIFSGDLDLNYSYAFLVLAGASALCAAVLACCFLWFRNQAKRSECEDGEGGEESAAAATKEEEAAQE